MPKKSQTKKFKFAPLEKSRLEQFNRHYRILERFGFTVSEAGELINAKSRTVFRMLSGDRSIELDELLALQTAVITALTVQKKVLAGELDLNKVTV